MSINNDLPPPYKAKNYEWSSEEWESKEWGSALIPTMRQLSPWEQKNAIVFNVPELCTYIVDRSALTDHTRIALAPLRLYSKDEIYFGSFKIGELKCCLEHGFKNGLERGAKHGFKTDFMTTFKNHLKRNKNTDAVDYGYVANHSIDFLDVREKRLRGEIMEAWVLDGMDFSSVDRISKSKFWAVVYMIKMRIIKGASWEYKP